MDKINLKGHHPNDILKKQQIMQHEITAYLEHINFANNCLVAYRTLYKQIQDNDSLLKKAPGFFTITQYALSKCLLIELSKLFCGTRPQRTIHQLLSNVIATNDAFTEGNAKQIYDDAKSKIVNEFAPIGDKLKARRDQDLTHNDPKYFFGNVNPATVNYISFDECQKLINFAFSLCINLLHCLPESSAIPLDNGADDLDDLLNWMQNQTANNK